MGLHDDSLRTKLLNLAGLRSKIRSLIDKYETDLLLFLVQDEDLEKQDEVFDRQMKLMRLVEQRNYKRFISDLNKILEIK